MAISQSEKELDAAFENARQLKEKIEAYYSPRNDTIHLQKNEIQKKIIAFIASNREIINRCIENKNTTSDILLAQIMKQFYAINKLMSVSQQTGKFFPSKEQNRLTSLEQLNTYLKTIDEIFNMLSQETLQSTTFHSIRAKQGS